MRYVGEALAPEYFIITAPAADFGAEANFAVLFAPLRTAQLLSLARSGQRACAAREAWRGKPGHGAGRARSLAQRSPSGHWVHVHAWQSGGGSSPALQGRRGRSAGDGHLRGAVARSGSVRGVQPDQSHHRGPAARDWDRNGARRPPARAGAPTAAARRPGGAPRDHVGDPGRVRRECLAAIGDAVVLPPAGAQDTDANRRVRSRHRAGIVRVTLATVIPSRRALSVTPVEAISVGARAAKSSGLAWITRGIRLPGGSLANMPLRNVPRTPRRTIMTVLGIGAVVAVTFALAGVIDSFNTTLDASRAEALAGSPQRLTVDLAAPQQATAATVQAIAGTPASGLSSHRCDCRPPSTPMDGGSTCSSRKSHAPVRCGIPPFASGVYRVTGRGWSLRNVPPRISAWGSVTGWPSPIRFRPARVATSWPHTLSLVRTRGCARWPSQGAPGEPQ